MAEISNNVPEDNPRLGEIYEVLLLAGYFRIRIASLKAFDKVIGGMAWCITSSNFEIEVDYSDEMQIGQKIRVAELICRALLNMKCPYALQPFQLQGLDVNNIFPVVQWLVKFVYETRFERQKYNREISLLFGTALLQLATRGSPRALHAPPPPPRLRVNRQIGKTSPGHPIRVYSALLEYSDATALRMYNKLHNLLHSKAERRPASKEDKEQEDLMSYLQNEEEGGQDDSLNNFGQLGSLSLTKV
jgi:hypothetical protein